MRESGPGISQTADFDLASYLDGERELVEAALVRSLDHWELEVGMPLAAPLRHGVLSGGKRLRPILCATAYRAAGGMGEADRLYDLAVSLELIHAYSLMHDDLPCMDDAELRRGHPTTHRVHGVGPTTVAGAVLIPVAVIQAVEGAQGLGCPETVAREVALELCRAAGAGGMVGGQALDLLAEGTTMEADPLDELHRLKTGALLCASLRMGAIAAEAGDEIVSALTDYGRAVGLAFQIADDVLDATSTTEELGKRPSDKDLGKSTYVTVHGLEEARRRGELEVERARSALETAALQAPALDQLARYVVERRR